MFFGSFEVNTLAIVRAEIMRQMLQRIPKTTVFIQETYKYKTTDVGKCCHM